MYMHVPTFYFTNIITGPPNGPVLFCSLASVSISRRRLSSSVMLPAGGQASGPAAGCAGGRAADTHWRASRATSLLGDTLSILIHWYYFTNITQHYWPSLIPQHSLLEQTDKKNLINFITSFCVENGRWYNVETACVYETVAWTTSTQKSTVNLVLKSFLVDLLELWPVLANHCQSVAESSYWRVATTWQLQHITVLRRLYVYTA